MGLQVDLGKHVFQSDNLIIPAGSVFPEVTSPALGYSNLNTMSNFITSWWAATEPFIMELHTVWHDFDQILFFCGGDTTNMTELGGKVEFYLGDEQGNIEKLLITKPTFIYVKAGMHHCPTKFLEIYDPKKPILFQDITLSGVYSRFMPGSNVRLNEKDEPIK